MRGVWATAAAACVAAACYSFSSADGEPADPPRPDGSVDDAPAVGQDGGECAPGAFCDGFERDAPIALGWSRELRAPGSSLTLTTEQKKSGARSLHVRAGEALGAGADRRALLGYDLTPGLASVTLTFAVRVETHSNADVVVAQLRFVTGAHVIVLVRGDRLWFDEGFPPRDDGGGPTYAGAMPVGAPLGQKWHAVRIAYAAVASAPHLEVSLDGASASVDVTYAKGGVQDVLVGSTFAQPGSEAVFQIDDVVIAPSR